MSKIAEAKAQMKKCDIGKTLICLDDEHLLVYLHLVGEIPIIHVVAEGIDLKFIRSLKEPFERFKEKLKKKGYPVLCSITKDERFPRMFKGKAIGSHWVKNELYTVYVWDLEDFDGN